ncbi:MAG TPA: nucleotidyltransferase family protein [bacterium]|nr:nucleotidyltransferase family protein [bacterium]
MISAIVLAAGRSERMGTPKLLLRLAGRSLLQHVMDNVRGSRCDEIIVVLGEAAEQVGAEAQGDRVRLVINPRYREGMGTSLAAGIAALAPQCEAAVVLLGDQPCVTAGMIDTLIDAYRRSGKPLVASRYGPVVGAPTLIGRALFPDARRLAGDQGGRSLIQQHPDQVEEVLLPPSAAVDVDTPEELARLRAALEKGARPSSAS